ncbi:uncharacterized protein METZ01_LOCUS87039 [marine metagenome]|uniref:Uncharacterized protein n=1 Tax=marine metagenome TaxID=408172 RepID=A0A381V1D6_9ZZZZ
MCEFTEERTFTVNRVKPFCIRYGHVNHFGSNNAQVIFFKATEYFSHKISPYSVWLDD